MNYLNKYMVMVIVMICEYTVLELAGLGHLS